jgi:cephalosporin hydroxylase
MAIMSGSMDMAANPGSSRPSESSVIEAVNETYRLIMAKIVLDQAGVPTAFDNLVLTTLRQIREDNALHNSTADSRKRLDLYFAYCKFASRERFIRYSTRARESAAWIALPWEPTQLQFAASQGVEHCLSWKGHALFKTVFDLAIYPMLLSELKPATIIELGSGTGASAIWFADLVRGHELNCRIYSLDLHRPGVEDPNVAFIEGDGNHIQKAFPPVLVDGLPHPWLVIEDMHVNTLAVLRYFSGRSRTGDYIIVEDSQGKQRHLSDFDEEAGATFKVDTFYTDFFGRNATCSMDSIFVKVA